MGSLNYLTGNMIPLFQIENLACLAQETSTEVLKDLTHGLIAEHQNRVKNLGGGQEIIRTGYEVSLENSLTTPLHHQQY